MAQGSIIIDLLLKTGSFETDTRKAAGNWKRLENSITSGAASLAKAAGFSTLTIGGLVTTVGTWAHSMARAGTEIHRLSLIANSSTRDFQQWAYATKSVGIQQDKLADILKDVNDKVGEFLSTGGGEMKDFFENIAPKIGVTAEQFRKLSGPQALQLYYDSLQKAGLSQKQVTFYMEALANDATALSPLLADNGKELQRLAAEAEHLSVVMDDKAIAASAEFSAQLDKLTDMARGLSVQLANDALPMLNAVAGEFLNTDKEAGNMHGTLKDLAGDNSFKNWLREALLMLATTADELVRIKGLVMGVIGSFQVAYADIRYASAWTNAKLTTGNRSPEDQAIADAVLVGAEANRNRTIRQANSQYDLFLNGLGEQSHYNRVKRALDGAEAQTAVSQANLRLANEVRNSGQTFEKLSSTAANTARSLEDSIERYRRQLRIKPGAESAGRAELGTYAMAKALQDMLGNDLLRFGALRDNSHRGVRSKHNEGLAFDATPAPGLTSEQRREIPRIVSERLKALGFEPGKDFRMHFEVKGQRNANGSVSSADHWHFQWQNKGAADRFANMAGGGNANYEINAAQEQLKLLEEQERLRQRIAEQVQDYIYSQQETVKLLGVETEAAKLQTQIELGAHADKTEAQQKAMMLAAQQRDEAEKLFEETEKYKNLVEAITGSRAIQDYLENIAMIRKAWEEGKISLEQYRLALSRIEVPEQLKNPDDLMGGINDGIARFVKNTGTLRDNIASFTENTFSTVADNLAALATGAKVSFREMAVSILADLAKIYIRMAMVKLVSSVAGGFADGGAVQKLAGGGAVFGAGTSRSDSIPALLSNGEFVVNAQATARNRPLLEALNRNRYASGGMVGGSTASGSPVSKGGQVNHITINIQTNSDDPKAIGDEVQSSVAQAMISIARREAQQVMIEGVRHGGIINEAMKR